MHANDIIPTDTPLNASNGKHAHFWPSNHFHQWLPPSPPRRWRYPLPRNLIQIRASTPSLPLFLIAMTQWINSQSDSFPEWTATIPTTALISTINSHFFLYLRTSKLKTSLKQSSLQNLMIRTQVISAGTMDPLCVLQRLIFPKLHHHQTLVIISIKTNLSLSQCQWI